MRFLKLHILFIAMFFFAASPAFASMSYNVSVDTTSLNGTGGYLYFQYYTSPLSTVNSVATVYNFSTDGVLAPASSSNVVDGSAVSGQLPGTVTLLNTNIINDYNHGISFGNTISFNLSLANTPNGVAPGTTTFSLALFADEAGSTPLLTSDGTLFTAALKSDGTATTQTLASQANVTPIPIPAAVWLLASGLAGLVGMRRSARKRNIKRA